MPKPTWQTVPRPLIAIVAQTLVREILRLEAEIEECRPFVPLEYLDSLSEKISAFTSALAYLGVRVRGLGVLAEESGGTPWNELPPELAQEVQEALLVEDERWEEKAFAARRRYLLARRDYCSTVSNAFKMAVTQLGYKNAVLHRFR